MHGRRSSEPPGGKTILPGKGSPRQGSRGSGRRGHCQVNSLPREQALPSIQAWFDDRYLGAALACDALTGRCFGHAVADPGLGQDVGRATRVIAQLAADLLHEGAHQTGVAAVRSPDPPQQVIVSQYPSGVD